MARQPKPFQRVFFIGAGLSAGLHYPVGRTLTARLVRYLSGRQEHPGLRKQGFTNSIVAKKESAAREIVETIEHFVSQYFCASLDNVHQIDVAEFYTMAQSLAEMPGLFGLGTGSGDSSETPSELGEERLKQARLLRLRLKNLYKDLASATRTYFYDINSVVSMSRDIEEVFRCISPYDAIVNFNWDEEADVRLSTPETWDVVYTRAGWQPPRTRDRRFLILRPHGSMGWYDLSQGIANEDSYLIAQEDSRIPRFDKRIVAYPQIELPKDILNEEKSFVLDCPPIITPPTFAKRFQYAEHLRIWQDVLEVCSEAKTFIFLGYSLPQDDYLTRAAIRSALRNTPPEEIRCLLFGRALDRATLDRFRSVFSTATSKTGFSKQRNFRKWTFGSDKPGFNKLFTNALQGAQIT